jgi:acyl-CoA thioesterase FadM
MTHPVFELTFAALPEHIDEFGHVNNAVWAMLDRSSGRPVRVPPEVVAPFLGAR